MVIAREAVLKIEERDSIPLYASSTAYYLIATGKIKGAVGDSFPAGKLGQYSVVNDPSNGPMLLLGQPTIFNKDNIDNFNF